jgi:predicted secreted protein
MMEKFPSSLHLSMHDNGLQLNLAQGQELHICLRANPATGFDWRLVEGDASILLETGRAYQVDSDVPGSPADLNLTYRVVGAGTTRLVLHYHRIWEKGIPPLHTFVLNIIVAQA